MRELPEEFLGQMKNLLGDSFESYLQSYEKGRFYGLRVNTDKISVSDFEALKTGNLRPVPWTGNGFYYDESERPGKSPYYYAGLFYLQEPSAMVPAESLPVKEKDLVLDVCAAPGGKSTALLNKRPGCLVSNDISNSRAQALLKNLELFGGTDYICMSEDPTKFKERFSGLFDKILIDAPCSGEGMFRKEPAVIKSWLEHGHDYFIKLQKNITEACLEMLKPGGMLLYSTCTFSVSEDEDIIAHLRRICPELRVLPIADKSGLLSRGVPDSEGILTEEEQKAMIRVFPHIVDGEGHFAALLQKGEAEVPVKGSDAKPLKLREITGFSKLPEEAREFLATIEKPFKNVHFELRNDHLALCPDFPRELRGLRILRNGLFLGELKKNRFEPSQALAMALKKSEFPNALDLPAEDENVIRYLKGETLVFPEEPKMSDGYVLVCVNDYPLGFAKKKGNVLKNKYLPGWRYFD